MLESLGDLEKCLGDLGKCLGDLGELRGVLGDLGGALRSAALQVLGSLGEFPGSFRGGWGRFRESPWRSQEVRGGLGRSGMTRGCPGGLGGFWECPGKV